MTNNDDDHAQKGKDFWNQPLTFEAKGLFLALGKGALHAVSLKWDDVAADALDAVAAVGLGREPREVGGILISRAMRRAVFALLRDFLHDFPRAADARKIAAGKADKVAAEVEKELSSVTVKLDREFLRHPAKIELIPIVAERLQRWLEAAKIENRSPKAIAARLGSHFVYALHCEFREKPDFYESVIRIIESPFTDALERDRDWQTYRRWLEWKLDESLFGEAFSLRQVFQWPRAWYAERDEDEDDRKRGSYAEDDEDGRRQPKEQLRHVVMLREELNGWLKKEGEEARRDPIRILSGDPGAGKSSFVRMFARHRFEQGDRVLVVPLHLIDDPQADFAKELNKFCNQVPDLPTGLLNDDTAPAQLLLVLDGLDELAKQGAAGAAVAQAFVEAVEKTVQRRNTEGVQTQDDGPRLRVLISGRPLAVQSVSNSFRAEGRVLEFLPYWVDEDHRKEGEENNRRFRFTGQTSLLDDDQRKEWWSNYGDLCGESYGGLPEPLTRDQFREITAQPLHNFLIAMVYRSPEGPAGDGDNRQSAIDFSGEVSLNEIYAHLLEKVYERSWGDAEGHVATKNVITLRGFRRLFQEMALAAWHHRERVTTIKAVEARCSTEQLKKVLRAYREKFTDGVAQLFAAFYVRGSDRLIDNEKTFEFTHKSFGEFLTACGIVGTLSRIARKLTPKDNEEDEDEIDPWDERKALNAWLELCGPTAITFDLQKYLSNEVAICYASEGGPERVASWRRTLGKMIDQMLATGMPAEKLQGLKFIEMDERARHAESALLILHACCVNAELADSERKFEPTEIRWPGNAAAAVWLRRICPQPDSWNSHLLILQSLTGLSLQNQNLLGLWLVRADLSRADLSGANLIRANLIEADLIGANLIEADLRGANLNRANLRGANLIDANLRGADLNRADLNGANLSRANLSEADLREANLIEANLSGANLRGADLSGADLSGADLSGADLSGANLSEANLIEADLRGANLIEADLRGADLRGADLNRADLDGATITKSQLRSAVGTPRTKP